MHLCIKVKLEETDIIIKLIYSVLVVICVVLLLFVLFYVLSVCKCVLYHCHRVSTQLQLTNMSYHIISYKQLCFDSLKSLSLLHI